MNIMRLIACVIMAALLAGCKSGGKSAPLRVYCAAGLREPMVDLVKLFNAQHPEVPVQVDYGGSGELIGRMSAAGVEHRPDVLLAAEESYAEQAERMGLVDRRETLAMFVPVIAVAKGNPKGVTGLADLTRPGLRVVLGEPRGPAIGLVSDQILGKAGLMSVRRGAAGSFTTVQAVALQVALGHADAAIIWDAVARQGDFPGRLDTLAIPDAPKVRIVICRVAQARQPMLADDFMRLSLTPQAHDILRKHGYAVQEAAPASQTGGSQ